MRWKRDNQHCQGQCDNLAALITALSFCYFISITYIHIHNFPFYLLFFSLSSCLPPWHMRFFLEGMRQRVKVQSVSCMQSFPDCCFCHPHPGDEMQDGSPFPLTCLTNLMCSCIKYFPSRQWKCQTVFLLVTWAYLNRVFLTRQHFRGLCPVKYPPVLGTAGDLGHTAHTHAWHRGDAALSLLCI